MLDMDGTLLDLAFDNFIWLSRVPEAYADAHGLAPEAARDRLYRWFHELRGSLDWYCLDHWSGRLDLDVVDPVREAVLAGGHRRPSATSRAPGNSWPPCDSAKCGYCW